MEKGYPANMRRYRVSILNKQPAVNFGETTSYTVADTVWAGVDWNRGIAAVREGALDKYGVVIIRMNYTPIATRDSRYLWKGRTFQVTDFWADETENKIQITATEIVQ
jgi:head-tail adaptor